MEGAGAHHENARHVHVGGRVREDPGVDGRLGLLDRALDAAEGRQLPAEAVRAHKGGDEHNGREEEDHGGEHRPDEERGGALRDGHVKRRL